MSLATLSGITFETDNDLLFLVSIFEMGMGILFISGIIAALVNYLSSRE